MVTELEITAQGNVNLLRNITTDEINYITALGLGPQTGQLCISATTTLSTGVVYIINLDSLSIKAALTLPDPSHCFPLAISTLDTGQILLTYVQIERDRTQSPGTQSALVLYKTMSHEPLTVRNVNTTLFYSLLAYRENFLIGGGNLRAFDVLDKQLRWWCPHSGYQL